MKKKGNYEEIKRYGKNIRKVICPTTIWTGIEGAAELLLQVAEKLTEYEEIIDKLATYVVGSVNYCPISDKTIIRHGCVGLRKPGCKECMLEHMEDFKAPPRISYVKISTR